MFSTSSPFRKVRKSLNKTLQRASDFLNYVGSPSALKLFRAAILSGDEDKAIEIYRTVTNGYSLEVDLQPSQPYPIKTKNDQTPMHLAALQAMGKLLVLLIEHGGNPNVLNANNETCLHVLCQSGDRDQHRRELIEMLLSWRGFVSQEVSIESEITQVAESVSVNRVDSDGNTATHYGAASGLAECVIYLVARGAIISIVNLDQMTPCEMADTKGHIILADMLEVALLFPPPEQDMLPYFDDDGSAYTYEHSAPLFELDCRNYTSALITAWKLDLIESAVCALGISPSRAEILLDYYSWDVEKMVTDYFMKPREVMSAVQLESVFEAGQDCKMVGDDIVQTDVLQQQETGIVDGCDVMEERDDCGVDVDVASSGVIVTVRSEEQQQQEGNDAGGGNEVSIDEVCISLEDPNDEEMLSPLFASGQTDTSKQIPTSETPLDPDPAQTTTSPAEKAIMDCPEETDTRDLASTASNQPGDDNLPHMAVIDASPECVGKADGLTTSDPPMDTPAELECCGICSEPLTVPMTLSLSTEGAPIDGKETTPSTELVDTQLGDTTHSAISCSSGHTFCLECWKTYATMQVVENGSAVIACMQYKCGEMLPAHEYALALLGPENAKRLHDNRVRSIVDRYPRFRWCPVADCGCIVHINNNSATSDNGEFGDVYRSGSDVPAAPGSVMAHSSGSALPSFPIKNEVTGSNSKSRSNSTNLVRSLPQTVVCANGHAVCVQCGDEGHAPCPCEQWKEWTKKVSEETRGAEGAEKDVSDVASALWVAANTKRCPRCQMPIEKDEGCNHMTCRKCRHEFCWICMQDWEKHSNRTGGFFQCNIYATAGTDDANGGDADADSMRGRGLGLGSDDDEYGSSTKETIRARHRSRLMERFIQYYTRYKAHTDSYTLESNMHQQTIIRIRRALHGSAVGDIPWLQGERVVHPYLHVSIPLVPGNYHTSIDRKRADSTGGHDTAKKRSTGPFPALSFSSYYRGASSGGLGASSPQKQSAGVGDGGSGDGSNVLPGEEPCCTEEQLDMNIHAVGDLIGHVAIAGDASYDASGNCSGQGPLMFLQCGFRELLKCRQILRGSFPMAYYFSCANDDLNEWGVRVQPHSLWRQRRTYADSRKQALEQAQAELEVLTETLSDVVARRRLRASHTQIERATRAARSRRLEFEAMLYKHLKAFYEDENMRGQGVGSDLGGVADRGVAQSRTDDLQYLSYYTPPRSTARVRRSLSSASSQSASSGSRTRVRAQRASGSGRRSRARGEARNVRQAEGGAEGGVDLIQQSMREMLLAAGWSEEDIRREGWDIDVPMNDPQPEGSTASAQDRRRHYDDTIDRAAHDNGNSSDIELDETGRFGRSGNGAPSIPSRRQGSQHYQEDSEAVRTDRDRAAADNLRAGDDGDVGGTQRRNRHSFSQREEGPNGLVPWHADDAGDDISFDGPSEEEETEINRAILMSLQDMRHVHTLRSSTASATVASEGVDTATSAAAAGRPDGTGQDGTTDTAEQDSVSEQTVNVLLNMGFSRERAVLALQLVGGGAENAIMYLLAQPEDS